MDTNIERWITVNGAHIPIRNGESVADAFKSTTGKNIESKDSSFINDSDAEKYLYDKNSVKSGWRSTDGLQPESCDSIDGLYKTVEAARQEFNDFTDSIANKYSDLNPIVMKRPNLKNKERIKEKLRTDAEDEKMQGKDYKSIYDDETDTYHCRTIRDCDGHTICMNSTKDVAKVLEVLDGRPEVVRIKNNFAKPSVVGYSDINMNVRLSNGAIVELQLNTTANLVAKERYGHALYEVYRSVSENPKYSELASKMADAQKNLYSLSNKYSKEGNFPTNNIPKSKNGSVNIYDSSYKHEPYAAAIRKQVKEAKPLFRKALLDGSLSSSTVEHFGHLVEYVGLAN